MARADLTSLPASQAALPPGPIGRIPAYGALVWVGHALFGLLIFLIGFDVSEPSPYDVVALPVMLLWLALGVWMAQGAVFFVGLLLIYCLGIFLAMVPYLDQGESVTWALVSLYLTVTAIFFVMFFSDDTERRVDLALKAFLASCLVNAAIGILGYFSVFGAENLSRYIGRASGLFDDPNVFGSFLILGVLTVVRELLTGEKRRPALALLALPPLLAGIFLSFSRGAWIATAIALAALLGTTFVTSRLVRVRRRIALVSLVAAMVGAGSIAGLLALDEVRTMFELRAQVTQGYDEGETGRFGNQLRAIPLLMELPNGFGPLRYRTFFGAEPHNSYLGAFANGGWIAGFAFIGLMAVTTYVGLRLCFRPSPYQRQAQIVSAAQLTFVVQSFQIDIDHWRHVYLVLAMIWGLEVARLRWLAGQRRAAAPMWTDAPVTRTAKPPLIA